MVGPVSPKIVEATQAHGGPGLEKDQAPNLSRLISTANRVANKYNLEHTFETGQHKAADESYLEALKMSKEELDELVDWAQVGILAAESVLE